MNLGELTTMPHCEIIPKSTWLSKEMKMFLFFVKFEIILSPFISFRPHYKYALQDMEFYNKLVNRFQDLSKVKNPAFSKTRV